MSNNRLRYEGLEELKAALRRLPEELHREAEKLVEVQANRAALDIRAAYQQDRRKNKMFTAKRSGRLVSGVVVDKIERTRFYAGRRVVSSSPLAYIYERGTAIRRNKAQQNRGAMPAAYVFVRTMVHYRKLMYDSLRDLIRRKGLRVSG